MSTLAEIEEAIESLPEPQQEELFTFLATRLRLKAPQDAFDGIIGAFAGSHEPTGRAADEILYGRKI